MKIYIRNLFCSSNNADNVCMCCELYKHNVVYLKTKKLVYERQKKCFLKSIFMFTIKLTIDLKINLSKHRHNVIQIISKKINPFWNKNNNQYKNTMMRMKQLVFSKYFCLMTIICIIVVSLFQYNYPLTKSPDMFSKQTFGSADLWNGLSRNQQLEKVINYNNQLKRMWVKRKLD